MRERRKAERDVPPKELQQMVLSYLEGRFGLEAALFESFGFYLASKGRVYLGPRRAIGQPRVVTLGLLIARISGTVKPSTNLLQAFGRKVTKNHIELDRVKTISYAKGENVRLSPDSAKSASDGYVLLKYNGIPLGCGLLKGIEVKNLLPKAKRLELRFL